MLSHCRMVWEGCYTTPRQVRRGKGDGPAVTWINTRSLSAFLRMDILRVPRCVDFWATDQWAAVYFGIQARGAIRYLSTEVCVSRKCQSQLVRAVLDADPNGVYDSYCKVPVEATARCLWVCVCGTVLWERGSEVNWVCFGEKLHVFHMYSRQECVCAFVCGGDH